ncbi:McrB family protein [Brevibacterium celere]|uniref:McrB family protein n=1 Tax=Brevibacterium celere TaxID=225845 RepID=UPI0031D72125
MLDYISASGFTFEPWQVATFVTALRTKPFVILAGISGTGKTKLPQLVAAATGVDVVIVPVRPDWTDSSDLLGYERLSGEFVPGSLLKLCEAALRAPDKQFFFILDEMNVARVEYYFAEVLSAMENRRRTDDGIISEPLNPSAPDDAGVSWGSVYLPANVSLIGTVNMDETTHGFSRKVLDRAFVLELSQVDLANYPSKSTVAVPAASWGASAWTPNYLHLSDVDAPDSNSAVTEAVNALVRANESLQPAQLQVGYRVRDEVALFCLNATEQSEYFVDRAETVLTPLDLCLSMKVLPRIQGGGSFVRDVLNDFASWTLPNQAETGDSESPSGFGLTYERVKLMQERLDQTGFTSYWV